MTMTPLSLALTAYLVIGAAIALAVLWAMRSLRDDGNPHERAEDALNDIGGPAMFMVVVTLFWPLPVAWWLRQR